jgi:hypothetical protein
MTAKPSVETGLFSKVPSGQRPPAGARQFPKGTAAKTGPANGKVRKIPENPGKKIKNENDPAQNDIDDGTGKPQDVRKLDEIRLLVNRFRMAVPPSNSSDHYQEKKDGARPKGRRGKDMRRRRGRLFPVQEMLERLSGGQPGQVPAFGNDAATAFGRGQ